MEVQIINFHFLFQETIAKYGCTPPVGINLNKICTNSSIGKKAKKFYDKIYKRWFTIKNCPYPCSFTKIEFRNGFNLNQSVVKLSFNKFIKTTTAHFPYGQLELLAEFGGYVGLFLGVSIFHLRQVFDKILQYF